MNMYLLPVTESYGYKYDYFELIPADSPQEAYNILSENFKNNYIDDRTISDNVEEYGVYKYKHAYYNEIVNLTTKLFHKSKRYDILKQYYKIMEDDMADLLYDFMYMGDYNKNISELVNMALPEIWTLQADDENGVLKRYLSKTFERLQEESKIVTTEKFCVFNTGLYTNHYEEIFIIAEKTSSSSQKEWAFREFCTEYRLDSTDITDPPQRADYFSDPSLLLFDWHYPVRVQYGHILDDERNKNRLPKVIRDSKIPLKIFTGVIDTSIKKVIANYKLAVPQYYGGQIQLLIPLYFEDDSKPELALTVTKKDGYYQGHTCLTLDMAYNNARLIAKPESNWLKP